MQFVISNADEGITVKEFLRRHLSLSSKMLKYLKYRPNGICVNNENCTVRRVLTAGDILLLAVEDSETPEHLTPRDLPLDILYETPDLVVPAKPADMPTHPSKDHHDDTVANALSFRYQSMGIPFVFRPIQRLDRNTSGLLLVARNKMAARELSAAMQEGRIKKTYLAVLDGEMTEGGIIDVPLHRTEKSIILREVCSPDAPDAAPSVTRYTVLAYANGHTLVKAEPLTGRTHQLRVHFASIGHPITGDDLYGTPTPEILRHALHAHTLTFPLPQSGEEICLTAPLPEDIKHLISTYFPNIDESLY